MSQTETTRRIDEWIQNWGLRLDETGRFIVSDGRILTTYQRLLIDKNQRAIRERLQEGYRRAWEANEAYLRQKALESIVPFIPPPRDTLQARRQPAEDRMARAHEWMTCHRFHGHQVKVWWGGPRIQIVNQHGETIHHPPGLLPELAWLLRDTAPACLGEEPRQRPTGLPAPAPRQRGVA